jgi:hypothetical protein
LFQILNGFVQMLFHKKFGLATVALLYGSQNGFVVGYGFFQLPGYE